MPKIFELDVNDAQYEAIIHRDGPMLVLAGPGSGKTLVITQRIKYLLEVHHIPPEEILVITFTKAAALEMQERFNKMMGDTFYPITFGTFHAIFFHIIKQAYQFNGSNIIKESEKRKFLSEAMRIEREAYWKEQEQERLNNRKETSAFQAGGWKNRKRDGETGLEDHLQAEEKLDELLQQGQIQSILSEISTLKNNGASLSEYETTLIDSKRFRRIYQNYEEIMRQQRKLDFDDMVLLCYRLLKQRVDILRGWQERFRYIQIDEFQDINPMQFAVMKLLADKHHNFFAVGDDDQSIYRFRGSEPGIMLHFSKEFPDARQLLLDVNYRSVEPIVQASLQLINHNKERFFKEIQTFQKLTPEEISTVQQGGMAPGVRSYHFPTIATEQQNIATLIKQYTASGTGSYSDIAILYRTNLGAGSIAEYLVKEKIPFSLKEKVNNMYDSFVAQDLLAYLQFAAGEQTREHFFRIMNKPVRYITRSAVTQPNIDKQQLLRFYQGKAYVQQAIRDFYQDCKRIEKMSPFAAINYIRKGIGYDAYLEKYAREKGTTPEEWLQQADMIQKSAQEHDSVRDWLEHIRNYTEQLKHQKCDKTENSVEIVTMHASKGLEWNMVILPEVNEGMVPHKKAGLKEELEEERRMFYVAMTRAKKYLFLFYIKPDTDNKNKIQKDILDHQESKLVPSRFLYEIYGKTLPE